MIRLLRALPLVLGLVLIGLAVSVPDTELAQLRRDHQWLRDPLNWIESLSADIDLTHVLLFFILGAAARWALPAWRLGRIMVLVAVVAAVSELVQFWVPGRSVLFSDFALDVVGAAAAVLPLAALQALWRKCFAGANPP